LETSQWKRIASAAVSHFDGAPVLVVLDLRPTQGHLWVDTSYCRDEAGRTDTLLAAAVIQARWGWDESPRIRIESGDRIFEVEPRFVDGAWRATLV
jgi:hypothetical protein